MAAQACHTRYRLVAALLHTPPSHKTLLPTTLSDKSVARAHTHTTLYLPTKHYDCHTSIVIHRLSHATLSCNITLTHNCVTHSSITQHAKHSSMTQRPSHTNNSVTQRHFLDTALHARFCSSWLFICAIHISHHTIFPADLSSIASFFFSAFPVSF